MFHISLDGYIRVAESQLNTLELVHLISGVDDTMPDTFRSRAAGTVVTGYTEWTSNREQAGPAVTIGWDWRIHSKNMQLELCRTGVPRSNLMIQDISTADLGQIKTATLLSKFVDRIEWQVHALHAFKTRYPMLAQSH